MPLGIPHSVFLDWDEGDQDKAIAWSLEQRKKCGGCNTQDDDWQRDKFAYVGASDRCPGCEILEQEREQVPPGQKGVRVYLEPRELAEARASAETERVDHGVS